MQCSCAIPASSDKSANTMTQASIIGLAVLGQENEVRVRMYGCLSKHFRIWRPNKSVQCGPRRHRSRRRNDAENAANREAIVTTRHVRSQTDSLLAVDGAPDATC